MSAPPLCVFLSPVSAPEAGPDHTCPHRPAGVQASLGMSALAGITGRGFGRGWCLACLDPHAQRRLCQGQGPGLGLARLEEALSGWCVGH